MSYRLIDLATRLEPEATSASSVEDFCAQPLEEESPIAAEELLEESVAPDTEPVNPNELSAEQLSEELTATMYINTSGNPDLRRFNLETGLIATKQANIFNVEYPISAGSEYSFAILSGNEQGIFQIDALSGMITLSPADVIESLSVSPLIDGESTVEFDFSDEPWFESEGTLIKDLASRCQDRTVIPARAEELGVRPENLNPEYSTWEEVLEDPDAMRRLELFIANEMALQNPPEEVAVEAIAANTDVATNTSTETSDELIDLITPTQEAPSPELSSAIEILTNSPTSTFDLLVGITSDFDRLASRSTLDDEMSVEAGAPASLSRSEITNKISETPMDKVYSLKISIDNQASVEAPTAQLPAATAPATTGCNQTMGAFGVFPGFTPPPGPFGAPPFPADDGFRPQPGPRGQMVLQVAHNEWLKSVTEPGKSSRRRVSEVIGRDTSWQQVSRYVYRDYSEQGLAKGGGPYDSSPARRSEWCGAFAAFCYGGAGLRKYYRKSVLPSTSRLQSYSRIESAFEKDYEDIDPSLRPPLPDRRDETLGGRVIWNPAPQQIIPGDILVMGPQPGASNFKNDYGNHISVVAEVTERGCYTYEGNGLGWIYGMPETDEFGGEGRREHGVIRGFCPFTPYADELNDYAVIYIHRPLEVDYYSAGQAPIGAAPNTHVPDTTGRSEEFVGD